MARSKQIGATQFKDLSPLWKVLAILGAVGGIAAGWFLPKWLTVIAILIIFPTVLVVQKVRGKT